MDAQATLLAPLTAGDRDAFERIVGSPPEDLLREVASLPSDRYWEVFSVAKFLNWPELNRREIDLPGASGVPPDPARPAGG
jgi:hypothetical protein